MSGSGLFAPSAEAIESYARAAIAKLPEQFAAHLNNVLLIVEDFAEDAVLANLGIEDPFALTGLYHGRPIGEPALTGDQPPAIYLYRRAILDEWIEGGEDLQHLVTHVVIHEIGHHFGLSDDDMHALEEAAK
jgi:predicted Zn-dependent protease with MMP-like domain